MIFRHLRSEQAKYELDYLNEISGTGKTNPAPKRPDLPLVFAFQSTPVEVGCLPVSIRSAGRLAVIAVIAIQPCHHHLRCAFNNLLAEVAHRAASASFASTFSTFAISFA